MNISLESNAQEQLGLTKRLINAGYTSERVVSENGQFKGMRVMKDGVKAHKSLTQSYDTSMELVRSLGY